MHIARKMFLLVALSWSVSAVADTVVVPAALVRLSACGGYECEVGQSYVGGLDPSGTSVVYDGSVGGGTSSASISPFGPTVSVAGTYATVSAASIQYYFAVSGPAGTMVPITVTGDLSVLGHDPSFVYSASASGVEIFNDPAYGGGIPLELFDCSGQETCANGVFHDGVYSDSFLVSPNAVLEVELYAVNDVDDQGYVTAAAASSDPFIQIDPDFSLENPGYSLEFSPGVINAQLSGTPEPSSLALFGTGAVGLFGVVRRRIGRRAAK